MATEAELGYRPWTLEELLRLPEDGNKYEIIDGELYVTPAPTDRHEEVLARLSAILTQYVVAQGLGLVFHPRAVVRHGGSQVEPDLFVRAAKVEGSRDWTDAPTPILVVEVLSRYTMHRDLGAKRKFYMRIGVPEYWIVDSGERRIIRVRPDMADEIVTDRLVWRPNGAAEELELAIGGILPAGG